MNTAGSGDEQEAMDAGQVEEGEPLTVGDQADAEQADEDPAPEQLADEQPLDEMTADDLLYDAPIADELPEDEPPIYALPPRIKSHADSQVEVSASPAFQCLDELFQSGKISGTKVALMKAQYTELHEALNQSRVNEMKLLQDAKEFTAELERQQSELERADNFPESINSEVSKLREQLLNHHNELAQVDERQYQLEYQLESLQEEKRIVDREYERTPKQGEVEKKIEELKQVCVELGKEITQRQTEAKNMKEALESKKHDTSLLEKDLQDQKDEMDQLKSELVSISSVPGSIAKEADKLSRQKNESDKKHKEMDSEIRELMTQTQQLQQQQTQLGDVKFELDGEVDRQAAILADLETDYQTLMKDYDYAREREAVLMGDKATLELNLRHINLEKKTTHDVHTRKSREKDRDLRNLKKAELQSKVAVDSLNHMQQIYDKVKSQGDTQPKEDVAFQIHKRQDLQKEVEQTKRSLAQQNSLTAVETVKVEQSIAEEERLLYEQSDLRIEVVELTRLAAIKNDEREQKARDFMRAEMRYHRAEQDLKTKQLQIQDHQKKYTEMQTRLKDFAKLYDIIKNERNKCVNLIQTSTQKAAEMREKIKILQNEVEILRTAVNQMVRLQQKQRLKHASAMVVRDSLRNEVSNQQKIEDSMREKRDQQRMDIAKLNLLINQSEEQMVQLRKRYETAVQHRNDRGIQLIERNEEVCIFYEKVNIQEQMIRNGNVELQSREEEIRFLKMKLAEEKRAIELMRQNQPNKRNHEAELVTLQIQLAQCQDRMAELEQQLEDPHDAERVRFLDGTDLTPREMQNKLEELEVRLSDKEERLLEKDLIFQQVTRLASRVHNKADTGKADTLNLAKKVNELQAKIKAVTRKMMAVVSELSMHQGNALRLQQEVKEKEADLEQCYMRLEKGGPPSAEIEREWLRMVRDEEQRNAGDTGDEEPLYTLPDGAITAAEPRPNAYIPEDDSGLPIPRPYGSHAPFKPNEPGSTMRHIRKPIPKPIEI